MERIHIAVIGPVNSGKSTLVNALCGQEVSLVSPVAGTTTDPVRKAVELPGIGPSIIIDTPGLEDSTTLGPERMRRTLSALDEADIAVALPPFPKIGQLHTWRIHRIPSGTYQKGPSQGGGEVSYRKPCESLRQGAACDAPGLRGTKRQDNPPAGAGP